MFAVDRQSIALPIRRKPATDVGALVPGDAEPLQVVEQLIFVTSFAALKVGVFDAQDHCALHLARKQPVVKCGAGVADVQLPCRRWGKTYAYLRILAHPSMLASRRNARQTRISDHERSRSDR